MIKKEPPISNLSYRDAAHAVQSGVKALLELGDLDQTDLKHVRVGINTSLCDSAALAYLLIKKGVITEEEYVREVTAEMNREVDRYEAKLAERGIPVKLR